jgi:quercetin dioxygenase-like cupin family protein
MTLVRAAARPIAKGKPDNFTGEVLLDTLTKAEGKSLLGETYVTFTPGARSVWHSHVNRQVLIVTAGWGALQFEGEPPQRLQPRDVAAIPPGVVHWHGSTPVSTLTHLGLLEAEGDGTTWMHPVSDDDFRAAGEAVRAPE